MVSLQRQAQLAAEDHFETVYARRFTRDDLEAAYVDGYMRALETRTADV